jgi:membrane protein YqaA with SNARE-associated domain
MWALTTLGVAFVSALVPIVNIEAYLLALAVAQHPDPYLAATAAAVGQMTGKMLFWLVGAGLLQVRRVQRKGTATGRWSERMQRLSAWSEAHWWGPSLITVASGFSGFPPFAVWSLLAGTIRMRWWLFLVTGLVGRFARFLVILLVPGLWPGSS